MKRILFALLLIVCLAVMLCGCTYNAEKYVFGTYYNITIKGKNAMDKGKHIDKQLAEMDEVLSTNKYNSDITKINNSKANTPVKVSGITASLFRVSKEIYNKTTGAYNPALFPLVELWCFSPSTYVGMADKIPTKIQIEETLEYCNFDLFTLDENNLTITKLHDNSKLDFGAIAKGYAVDIAYEIAQSQDSAIIDIGRTYKVMGDITLMVANPRTGDFVAQATLSNQSVATSGDYERYYIYNNKRYNHIIARDGYPAGTFESNPIISATIVGDSATWCDALSTAVMVLGYESSVPLLENLGYSALLLTEDGYYTIGDNIFEIKDTSRKKLN